MILKLAMVSGVISFVISESILFKPLRERITNKFFCKLISCGFCQGFHYSFILEAIYQPNIFNCIPIMDEILTSLAMAYLSGVFWLILNILFDIAKK